MLDCGVRRCRSIIVEEFLQIFDFLVILGLSKSKIWRRNGNHQNPVIIGVFSPPLFSPQEPHAVRRAAKMNLKIRLVVDQNFDHFLDSIFGRFWLVLGRHLGVIFGTFGGQVRS